MDKIVEKYDDVYEFTFDELLKKLQKEYLCFSTRYSNLLEKKDTFMALNEDKKISVIKQIILLMSCSNANMTTIGLGDRFGRMSKQQFGDKRLRGMVLVDKSVTGMYEKRIKVWDGE